MLLRECKEFKRIRNKIIDEYILLKHYASEYHRKYKGKQQWGEQWKAASTSRDEYIRESENSSYFIKLAAIREGYEENSNLFDFENPVGLLKIGLCWWHSRFQRSALYLTTFRPEENKPRFPQITSIVNNIKYKSQVVEIGGFNNFDEFSKEYEDIIVRSLSDWQLLDGIVFWSWLNGIAGDSEVPPDELKIKMDKLYKEVAIEKHIAFVKLQIEGLFIVHAWLITEMKKEEDGSYYFKAIDSNYPRNAFVWHYKNGSSYIPYLFSGRKCVPYIQYRYEINKCKKAIDKYTAAKLK